MLLWRVKSHNLPSATWRPRKAGSTIQSKAEDLKTRDTNKVDSSLMTITVLTSVTVAVFGYIWL